MTEYGPHLSFPLRVGSDRRLAQVTSLENHIREELIQLILTNPGERLFLPNFGGGVRRLVFENADPAEAGLVKANITQAISTWLGHRVSLVDLKVEIINEKIEVTIKYKVSGSEETRIMQFQKDTKS